ncbi:TlpA disulfide reductase family protein [Pseudonocardia sp. KRD291]|uniref:TlpA family protein disulfide reductase n=1 Tax=Pseudonocardia sp. KRD291 TaxID=2792007 RepID=UPI001C4A020F|nr:TlpA disulfide reductase family protein [Pseudonocardia sp. KRD291]
MSSLLRSSEVRATALVVVLVVVGVVALWPRAADPGSPSSTAPWRIDGTATMAAPQGPQVDSLRAAAALRPCPAPRPDSPAGTAGPLAGITVPCLGGPGEVDLAAALAGRPALLNVWASWCGPCRDEIPVLNEYTRRADSVPVVGIDVRDDAVAALGLLDELGAQYPSVVDTDAALWKALRVPYAIPTTYVVRPDGSAQQVSPPKPFRTADEVSQTVERYLKEPR